MQDKAAHPYKIRQHMLAHCITFCFAGVSSAGGKRALPDNIQAAGRWCQLPFHTAAFRATLPRSSRKQHSAAALCTCTLTGA